MKYIVLLYILVELHEKTDKRSYFTIPFKKITNHNLNELYDNENKMQWK